MPNLNNNNKGRVEIFSTLPFFISVRMNNLNQNTQLDNIKRIRIGNDIRLRINLLDMKGVDTINIKSIKVYIINTSREKEKADKIANCTKFISRFPCEPHHPAFEPSAYDLNLAGLPRYYAYPEHHCHYFYHGFGLHPDWSHIYPVENCTNDTEFIAPVQATEYKDQVDAYFPANSQLYCGVYKIVVVARIYQPGYGLDNLRTITMDYNNIFRLVDDSTGTNSDVTIEIGAASEVGVQGLELSGSTDMIVGETQFISTVFTPSNATNKQITCTTSGSSVETVALSSAGFMARATQLPNPAAGDTYGTVVVTSYDNSSVSASIKIKVHNYATAVTLGTNNSISIPAKTSITVNPSVLLESADIVTNYKISGKTHNAAQLVVDGIYIKMQDGPDLYEPLYGNYATVTEVGNMSNDIIITNNGINTIPAILRVKIVSNIVDEHKQNIEKTFDIQLQPSTAVTTEDKYIQSGVYNKQNSNIQLYRSDNTIVNVDLSDELGWYEGE